MFLTTNDLSRPYIIRGIVTATVKRTLEADQIDEVDAYDELYAKCQSKLAEKAIIKNGDGIIGVRFSPEIVRVSVGPKFMLLHGYGTAVSFLKKEKK